MTTDLYNYLENKTPETDELEEWFAARNIFDDRGINVNLAKISCTQKKKVGLEYAGCFYMAKRLTFFSVGIQMVVKLNNHNTLWGLT